MVNKIWTFFIAIGIIFSLLSGNISTINNVILESAKSSLELMMQIFPVIALWLGITNIATNSGLLDILSLKLSIILGKLFPEVPKNHISLSYMASNMIANIFGLGSAATPFGLKAMSSLQELNENKKVASRSMITFTTINTSGLTVIPTTIIALRLLYGSTSPTITVLSSFIATLASTLAGIIIDRILARRYTNV